MKEKYINADAFAESLRQFCEDAHWGIAEQKFSVDQIIGALEMHPTVDVREVMASAWIPVSERLPSNGDIVICTEHYPQMDYVRIMYYMHGRFNTSPVIDEMCNEDMTDNITAWMPLLEPYKADNPKWEELPYEGENIERGNGLP